MRVTRSALPSAKPADRWSADPYTRALRTGRGPLFLQRADGLLLPLDVERWCARADAADRTVLARCRGSVLDIGCGPGRLVAALAELGRPALGIDVSAEAVRRARRSGGTALVRSVFEPLPGEGRWRTALLIDGNVGIGGDPAALLLRIAGIVRPAGSLIVETAPAAADEDLDERVRVRLGDGGGAGAGAGAQGEAFPWCRVGPRALTRHAAGAGWTPTGTWTALGRRFVALRLARAGPWRAASPGGGRGMRSRSRTAGGAPDGAGRGGCGPDAD
ncbi:methyltransferase domain-containing protein [Streptomyces sp. NBC_01190]|nr:methyltransferase domain-containing protein [Streptomyces sp. NBC_01190]